jgi:hypothetical protein
LANKIGPGIIVMLCGFAGVIVAFIEKTLYDNGVGVNALANMEITLTEAMTITIVVWLLVGAVVALIKS